MATRLAWLLALLLVGCGEPGSELDAAVDASVVSDGGLDHMDAEPVADGGLGDAATIDGGERDAGEPDGGARDAALDDAGAGDAGPDDGGADAGMRPDGGHDAGPPDGGDGSLEVRVLADAHCADLSFDPPSIAVPAGTRFTVRWVNATGCTPIDIDLNGTVPIVLGLQPGERYHDMVREWCGSFTGTYVFRAYYAPSFPYYLDVDCAG